MTTESQAPNSAIGKYLAKAPAGVFVLYAIFASFSTYFCMYAFRKPFSAAKYEDLIFINLAEFLEYVLSFDVTKYDALQFLDKDIPLKIAFVISQIIGYCISKYLGCKICSEVSRNNQAKTLIGMIGIALTPRWICHCPAKPQSSRHFP